MPRRTPIEKITIRIISVKSMLNLEIKIRIMPMNIIRGIAKPPI
jgi:hypothetical protein